MSNQPPLRMDVGDPGHDFEVSRRIEVLLNGVPRTKVISYDVEARTLTRYVTDEQGHIVIERELDKLKRETLTGDVGVRWIVG